MLRRSVLLAPAGLAACASPPIEADSRPEPALPIEWFAGTTYAYGVFEGRGGRVTERFTTRLEGRPLADGAFELFERFAYPNGFIWARTWTFRPGGGGVYDGTAETVVGTGRITVRGDTIRMNFVADQPTRDGAVRLRFDQRLTRLADDVVVNRSMVSKFGVRVGRITMVFTKPDRPHPAAASIRSMSASESPK